MIKRALKVAGVFGLLTVCLALDNPPPIRRKARAGSTVRASCPRASRTWRNA